MDLFTLVLLGLTAAVALAVGIEMARRPILVRVAVRNAVRRPRQTLTVVAGLMVGTAIISAALVAGGSAAYAIRGYVYQSLGAIDESVAIQGYPYFPQEAYDELRSSPDAQFFDGIAAHTVWQSAVELPRVGSFEPNVAWVGYEPERDAAFGEFHLAGGGTYDGRSLQPGQAIATKHVADALGLEVGDRVHATFTPPADPLLPEVTPIQGNVTAALAPGDFGVPTPPLPGVPIPNGTGTGVSPVPATHTFLVNRSATRVTAVIAWNPVAAPGAPPSVHLALELRDPTGALHTAEGGRGPPAWLNVTVSSGTSLPAGNWTLTVRADAAARTAYRGAIVVAYPVYDLGRLQQRAQALQAEYGSFADGIRELSPFTGKRHANLTIVAITDGGRGSLFDFRDALFLRMDEMQTLLERQGSINLVKLSNPGDIEAGAQHTDEAMRILNATLARLREAHPDVPAYQSLEANPLKRDYVRVADEAGETLTNLLVFAGSLTIITGILLLLNIFTVLAEERRSELGMARAVGMSRADLVRSFTFEGSLYALAAAAAGALLGLLLAAGMIAILNAVIGSLASDLTFPPIPYRPTAAAVLTAFAVGSLITFATIVGASVRKSRLNVVRAIRRIEEPDHHSSSRRGVALGVALAVLGIAAATLGWAGAKGLGGFWGAILHYRLTLQVGGALLAAIGIGLALRPTMTKRRLLPLMAAFLAAYYTVNYFVLRRYDNMREANIIGPVRGVLLTLCVVILVVHWEWLSRTLGRLLARMNALRAVAIPAVSYPLHKKFRTGLTLAMFSVVILSIGFFSIFGALFQSDPLRQTGGYDIEARPTLTVPDLAPYDRGLIPAGLVAAHDHLRDYVSEDPHFITIEGERIGSFGDYRHNVYGFEAPFVEHQRFKLLWRDTNYTTDQEAYRDVLEHDDRIIVAYPYSTNRRNEDLSHKVGDTLEMHLGDQVKRFRIAGIQEQYHFNGVFISKRQLDSLFPQAIDLHLYRLEPGSDAAAAARLIESNYRDVGMDAKSTVDEVLEEQKAFRQILGAMKLFLGLGLVVGVLSLGLVTSRSVLERRQEIGMLRALGFTAQQVRRIFFIEMTYTLLLGALVGLACAVVVTYGLWFSVVKDLNYPYVIPWGELGILLGVSYLVALLATVLPIGKSGKVAPAEALRYTE